MASRPPATVIRTASTRLRQKPRAWPPQPRLRASSTGMKMPDEPQTISRTDMTSNPRATLASPCSETAIASRSKGISSFRTSRRDVDTRRPGSCCDTATRTRTRGKRQRRKLKAIALVITIVSRASSSPATDQSRDTTPGRRARGRRGLTAAAPPASPPRSRARASRASSGRPPAPEEVRGQAEREQAQAPQRFHRTLDERVQDERHRGEDEHDGDDGISPHPVGPGVVGPLPPQDEHGGSRRRVEKEHREDDVGVEL